MVETVTIVSRVIVQFSYMKTAEPPLKTVTMTLTTRALARGKHGTTLINTILMVYDVSNKTFQSSIFD